jgi:hypothetical protein
MYVQYLSVVVLPPIQNVVGISKQNMGYSRGILLKTKGLEVLL